MSNSIEASREEFEAWLVTKYPNGKEFALRKDPGGSYSNIQILDFWEGWKAAKAAPASEAVPVASSETNRQLLYRAAINCSHAIDSEEITLHRNPRLPGNTLSQLADRLDLAEAEIHAALSQPPLRGGVPAVSHASDSDVDTATLLDEASDMLTDYALHQRDLGNDSTAAGADAHAHRLRRLNISAAPQTPIVDQGVQISDAARLDFIAYSPSRYVERSIESLWRVYEDKADQYATEAEWRSMTNNYYTSPRAAIDAAIQQSAQVAKG